MRLNERPETRRDIVGRARRQPVDRAVPVLVHGILEDDPAYRARHAEVQPVEAVRLVGPPAEDVAFRALFPPLALGLGPAFGQLVVGTARAGLRRLGPVLVIPPPPPI